MGTLRKILLLGLPASLENALKEQLSEESGMTPVAAEKTAPGEVFDLIVTAGQPALRPGVPLLSLAQGRKERLGDLMAQMERMIEDPALWLEDFKVGPYVFSPSEKTLCEGEKDAIPLTDRETDILIFLARHAQGGPVSRDALLKNVWRYHEDADTHTLETHIYRLRQKMERRADAPEVLVTAEGGYKLNLQESDRT